MNVVEVCAVAVGVFGRWDWPGPGRVGTSLSPPAVSIPLPDSFDRPRSVHPKNVARPQRPFTLPPEMLAKLETLKPILAKNGGLEYRSNGTWRLRHFEVTPQGRRRRSLALGRDDHVACEIELWLGRVRWERARQRAEAAQHKREARVEQRKRRLYTYIITQGGRDRKRWAWRTFQALEGDPVEQWHLVMTLPRIPAPKIGRPRKGAVNELARPEFSFAPGRIRQLLQWKR